MSLQAAADQMNMIERASPPMDVEEMGSRANQAHVVYHQWATFRVDNELYGIDVVQV